MSNYSKTSSKTSAPKNTSVRLDQKRLNGILSQLNIGAEEAAAREKEKKFCEYLKTESKKMINSWDNSKEAIRAKANEEKQKKEKEKIADGERKYKALMESDENSRKEQLAKSTDIVFKLKPGAKQLESAAVYAEVLKGREIQRAINAEVRSKEKSKHMVEGKETVLQAHQWMEDQNNKKADVTKRSHQYKSELREFIRTEELRKEATIKRSAEIERQKRDVAEQELKLQIERERDTLQRKREILRRNALEAMVMAEQRRKRELLADEAHNKLIAAYTAGKDALAEMQTKSKTDRCQQITKMKKSVADQIYLDDSDTMKAEDERIRKHETELKSKLQLKEREKNAHEKKLKAARIEWHLREVAHQNQLKAQTMEDLKTDMNNRMKNTEITHAFERAQKQNRFKVLTENRNILVQQTEERLKEARAEKAIDEWKLAKTENQADDEHFFEYAKELIGDAQKKGRPILPLRRAIETYKQQHRLHMPKEYPKHLVSNVPIMKDCKHCAPIKYNLEWLKSQNPDTVSNVMPLNRIGNKALSNLGRF